MSKGVTKDSLLSVLPGVLRRDKGMYDLAQLIGWIFGENAELVNSPAVFQHIDELDESLLDIIAKDCKVDWYDYDADIAVKRRQIKTNWHVRKSIGTVEAVKTALQSAWPYSTIEEWYEYDGEPGYFRAIINMEEGVVHFNSVSQMIELFKPVRAHIDGYVILRVRIGIKVKTRQDKIKYHVPAAGTIPRYSTHGDKSHESIVIESRPKSVKYHDPKTGKLNAGTYPHYYTHGDKADIDIEIESESISHPYLVPETGMVVAGTHPDYSTHGNRAIAAIQAESESDGTPYTVPITGTVPEYATHGKRSTADINLMADADGAQYTVPIAGTVPVHTSHGAQDNGGVDVCATSVSTGYGTRKCGTSNNSLF